MWCIEKPYEEGSFLRHPLQPKINIVSLFLERHLIVSLVLIFVVDHFALGDNKIEENIPRKGGHR